MRKNLKKVYKKEDRKLLEILVKNFTWNNWQNWYNHRYASINS